MNENENTNVKPDEANSPPESLDVTYEEFRELASEVMDEFPDGFFRGLSGGVIAQEGIMYSEYAKDNDLVVAGQYKISQAGKQVILYYGSMIRLYPKISPNEMKKQIRRVIKHEMRHFYEIEAGDHSSKSLEAEDRRQIAEYLQRRDGNKA